ncbi:putative methyltransferase-domain-containing protein [Mortierella sp. GBAus27b]|nr:putative methyltransferase-domain-containing protein [Mortierella sp. GBAus27b]
MEPARPLLMIEGPKFSGFDFTPMSATAVSPQQQSFKWSPNPEGLEPFIINGHRIVLPSKGSKVKEDLEQDDESSLSHTAKTAGTVWDCGILLSKYLEALSDRTPGYWTGKHVLELGAGQGIVSFSAAALGAGRVIATDVDSAVPSLQEGIRLNGFSAPQVQVVTLDWTNRTQAIEHIWNDLLVTPSPSSATTGTGQSPLSGVNSTVVGQQLGPSQLPSIPRIDYILASDVIWVDYLVSPLVETIGDLMRLGKPSQAGKCHQEQEQGISSEPSPLSSLATSSPIVLLAYQSRSTRSERLLFDALDQLGVKRRKLCLTGIDKDDQDAVDLDPKYQKPNLAVWKMWRE